MVLMGISRALISDLRSGELFFRLHCGRCCSFFFSFVKNRRLVGQAGASWTPLLLLRSMFLFVFCSAKRIHQMRSLLGRNLLLYFRSVLPSGYRTTSIRR